MPPLLLALWPVLRPALPWLALAAGALGFVLWQRHDAAEAVRREVAAEAAATITHAEEARREADTAAAVAANPADELRKRGILRSD